MRIARIIIACIVCLTKLTTYSDDRVTITGEVYEPTMNEPLLGATVRLLNARDSSFVTAVPAESTLLSNGEKHRSPRFRLTLPSRDRGYILGVSYTGYETKYADIDPGTLGKRQYEMDLGKIYLAPAARKLGEVSVTATKVKFYNRGDTVVYNADAFNLAEGSMLDALIRQLPDVRMTQQGEIFVSGEKIESLLLDGKDFFKDNRQIMLNNLGAYMVRNVEVYKKSGFESEVSGLDTGDRQLVMDIKLKRQYMVGLVGNVEGGYGTHDRYMGRLFTGAFTRRSKLAIYANANNVNASQAPQLDTDWRPETMPTGTKSVAQGGVKYGYDSPDTRWSVFTSADFSREREDDGTDTYRTNFLNSGNTYENSFGRSRSRVLEVKSWSQLAFKNLRGYGFQFMPEGGYSHWDRSAGEAAASFNEKVAGLSASVIEDIYGGNHDNLLRYVINRDIECSRQHGTSWNAGGNFIQTLAVPNTSDQLTVRLHGTYRHRRDDRFERFDINYGQNPDPANSANRYYRDYPDFNSRVLASAKYLHFLSKDLRLTFTYEYEHSYSKNTSELYRLGMLDLPEEDFFGTLPSAEEYRMTIDRANSYLSRHLGDTHRVTPRIEKTGSLGWWCEIPINFSTDRLHYVRGAADSRIERNYVYIDHGFLGIYYNKDSNYLYWQGTVRSSAPDMVCMVEMTDATDPLNVTVGNPDLRLSTELNTYVSYRRTLRPNASLSVKLEYQELFNALARGYIYDSSTGVRESSMYNVDGNRFLRLNTELNLPLGRALYFRNSLDGAHVTSVDLVGADTPELFHNRVRSLDLHENLTLSSNFRNQSLYVTFDGNFRRYSANLSNFTVQDTWTFRTGVGALLNLPFNFQLSTDVSMYNRRGYTDPALNTDNFVWNARLAYRALGGSLLFMVDGYDMLRNISNVSYTVNAQARTEAVRTVLPSYFMFHLQWRFSRQPKKI